ncbi:MAG: alpha/beta hydrolase [Proteobacteria bacterium]|nr:alpha/beta hydrolase [Pseudomonadota bacterium]
MVSTNNISPDYSHIDRTTILHNIFFPFNYYTECPENAFDLSVPVDNGISVSCRFYVGNDTWPWILFFHGNGEVVSDYDETAPLYMQRGLNLVVADYRGYGKSSGVPTLTDTVRDAHIIFQAIKEELAKGGFRHDLWIMGRSLGSVSALELAYHYQDGIKGLIIESGFPSIASILTHLDIPTYNIDLEQIYRDCVHTIRGISIPTLIIHGEYDTLVPLKEAQDLYQYIGTKEKQLLIIPRATHNDILFVGFDQYFDALHRFIEVTDRSKKE